MKKLLMVLYFISSCILGLLFLRSAATAFGLEYSTESSFTTEVGKPPAETGANITSCTFYRSGDGIPGLKIGNPQMAALITDVATKVGIPPAMLAGVMRVESAQALNSKDPTFISNDYDPHPSGGSVAFGTMQFTPGTFISTFDQNRVVMASLFNKTGVSTKIVGQNDMEPASLLRIYSVKDSIIAAAFKIKKDKENFNGSGPWNEAAANAVATRYYGCLLYPSCNTGPNSYGGDLWKSYSSCLGESGTILSPIRPEASDCPLQGGIISCGSQFTPIRGCGHCGLGYPASSVAAFCGYPGTKYAIDIGGVDFQSIYLPRIDGHVVNWKFVYTSPGRTEEIQGYAGIDQVTQKSYYIQLHHTQPGSGNSGARVSGDVGGIICGFGCNEKHTHIQIGTGSNIGNVGWLDAAQYFCR